MEIGPGPGYFSTHVAQKVSKGKLVLLDIQKDMLDRAKKRINKRKIKNVEYRLANGRTLEFDNNYFDVIFMVTVFGEVENKSQYLAEIHRTLKKGGILSISEQAGDPDKMDIDEIRQVVCQFNFSLENIYGKNWNYTANFSKN